MNAFDRLAPFIRDYIYENRWEELRAIQVAACEVLFDTDDNLLLSSGTASGKTEAAFLPALTILAQKPADSVGILYVGPLKALINDQFRRLNDLLREGGIPVTKWHGDASAARKRQILADPKGVLQITPESLEGLLMRRPEDCKRLFADTRFVVIDEVHHFMGSPRGAQLLCQLSRIARLTGCVPRRVGLSATLSDPAGAAAWLNADTGRACQTPRVAAEGKRLRLSMDYFPLFGERGYTAYISYIFRRTIDKKAIVFANSRAEAEHTVAALRAYARTRRAPDVYRAHHGSLSAALREEAERAMKESDQPAVTAATLTLELGIDIGALDCVVQLGAPFTASSLVQRIGRCGRRGQSAELAFALSEQCEEGRAMNWEFLKALAILQLYLEERWTEPGRAPRLPYPLLYHQTLSCLYAQGETRAPRLAQTVLTLPPFAHVEPADYQTLLKHWLALGHLEKTERGGLIVGQEAEPFVNHYTFLAVFDSPTEYLVRFGGETLGSVTGALAVGEKLMLAGRVWEVVEVDDKAATLFVREAKGEAESPWQSDFLPALDGKIARKMRDILWSDREYGYMGEACQARLTQMRAYAREAGLTEGLLARGEGGELLLLPWLSAGQLYALHFALLGEHIHNDVGPDGLTPIYLTVSWHGAEAGLLRLLKRLAEGEVALALPEEIQIPAKFQEWIPQELRTKEYIADFLDVPGLQNALKSRL